MGFQEFLNGSTESKFIFVKLNQSVIPGKMWSFIILVDWACGAELLVHLVFPNLQSGSHICWGHMTLQRLRYQTALFLVAIGNWMATIPLSLCCCSWRTSNRNAGSQQAVKYFTYSPLIKILPLTQRWKRWWSKRVVRILVQPGAVGQWRRSFDTSCLIQWMNYPISSPLSPYCCNILLPTK